MVGRLKEEIAMLFITNRIPIGSVKTRVGRAFRFDLKQNAPANSVFYCERQSVNAYIEIGAGGLMERLKKSRAGQVLFYIHGFSNLPEPDIFPRAERLQALFDEREPDLVDVVPIIWPCDNDFGIVKDYWDDQKSADISAFSFARVLQKFMAWQARAPDDIPCLKRINVLAHSMGNRVLRETLSKWDHYDLADGVPLLFRNVFLAAADIVNESLEHGKSGRFMSQAARNVIVYHASDDLALRSSKISNLKNKIASRRLGHTGPENMERVQANVYSVDCDNFNSRYDSPKGHSYFLDDEEGKPGLVFEHMFHSVQTGRVKLDRAKDRPLTQQIIL
jgi:esterase/lipase superfamily enzyme